MEGFSQRAGHDARQIAISGDVNVGLSATEAMDIARYVARDVIATYTSEALKEAERRINAFDEKLISVMQTREGYEEFRDPSFQQLVRTAQRSAASTDREDDFARLAQLVAERRHGNDRMQRTAMEMAIQAVDRTDDKALNGLVAARCMQLAWASGGDLESTVNQFERFISVLVPERPAAVEEWIEHAESLGLARTTRSESFQSSQQVLAGAFYGLLCPGVDRANSEALSAAVAAGRLGQAQLPLIEHDLKPGFMRYPIASDAHLAEAVKTYGTQIPSTEKLRSILAIHTGYPEVDGTLIPALHQAFTAHPGSKRLLEWWDQQNTAYRITAAGHALAAAQCSVLLSEAMGS